MTTFITADTHFGHANVLRYDPRPFETIEEHDETLIQRWNEKISPQDTVFHLGDIALCSVHRATNILRRLNGDIVLIKGNHEKTALQADRINPRFLAIHDYLEIKRGPDLFCLFHYPIHEWNKCHYGSYMLHGHTHGNDNYDRSFRVLNVGTNLHNYYPLSLDEIVKKLEDRKIRSHH